MPTFMVLRDLARAGSLGSGPIRAVPEPLVQVFDLPTQEVLEGGRAPEVAAIAVPMPTQLITPLDIRSNRAASGAWGISAVMADESQFTGDGVVVAMLDTGIDKEHPAFSGISITEQDFTGSGNGDAHGHGTHCAGTIFGRDVNGMRIGVARGVKKALIGKVLTERGTGSSEMVFQGLQWALEAGAQVIFMALTFDFSGSMRQMEEAGLPRNAAMSSALAAYRGNVRLFDALMQMIKARAPVGSGAVVVAAAGNESHRPTFTVPAPFGVDGLIEVGAVGRGAHDLLEIASFSNSMPSVAAPGLDIVSAKIGGGLTISSGTSMACAHVAGVAALQWEALNTSAVVNAMEVASNLLTNARTGIFARNLNSNDWGTGLVAAPNGMTRGHLIRDTEISGIIETGRRQRFAEEGGARVVNLSFLSGKRYLSGTENLVLGREYELRLQISRPWGARSIVRNAPPVPDRYLDAHSDSTGIDLDVCLYTEDFSLKKDVFALRLPRAPDASNHLDMSVTPTKLKTARLRVCIYYRNNLIQSLSVVASVAQTQMPPHEDANHAEVEFSMADTLLGLDDIPPRTLNLLTSDRTDGTHKIAIRGTDLKLEYTVTGSSAVADVRKTLLAICAEVDGQGRPTRYRYSEKDNSGGEVKFITDLKALAALGDRLYSDLIMDPANWDEQGPLEQQLKHRSEIQISITKSARNVYPWALLYDRKLESGPDVNVCPVILRRLTGVAQAATLHVHSCVDGACPHAADTKMICPFGFWGFRHAIEQLPPNQGQIIDTISAAPNLSFIMAVHQQLAGREHRAEVESAAGITAQYLDVKDAIGTALKSAKPHFVYFYCHGGRSANVPWLGVGNGDRIAPTDFRAWDTRWKDTTPIVVVNGCHTVDLSPDDLLDFVKVFAWCRAAGVIGTEIAIPESLGREFGTFFISRFVKGDKVATIIRDFRLTLLAKRNVLGLSYSPYCHGDLRLVVN
jgi:subtilisin family serine protease